MSGFGELTTADARSDAADAADLRRDTLAMEDVDDVEDDDVDISAPA